MDRLMSWEHRKLMDLITGRTMKHFIIKNILKKAYQECNPSRQQENN